MFGRKAFAPVIILLALVSTGIFTGCILGLGAASSEIPFTGDLALILDGGEDCPMPCWAGIRPGVTSADEALNILYSHPWIGEVQISDHLQLHYNSPNGQYGWRWNGAQPAALIINAANVVAFENRVVTEIMLHTRIPTGAIWRAYERPTQTFYRGSLAFELFQAHSFLVMLRDYCQHGTAFQRWHNSEAILIIQESSELAAWDAGWNTRPQCG